MLRTRSCSPTMRHRRRSLSVYSSSCEGRTLAKSESFKDLKECCKVEYRCVASVMQMLAEWKSIPLQNGNPGNQTDLESFCSSLNGSHRSSLSESFSSVGNASENPTSNTSDNLDDILNSCFAPASPYVVTTPEPVRLFPVGPAPPPRPVLRGFKKHRCHLEQII